MLEPGRALSVYGDGGWGRIVQRARHGGEAVPDELVEAAVALVRGWATSLEPTWVTAVPSADGDLVPQFAQRLAAALGLPFHDAVTRVRRGRPQKEMANSSQQFGNVYGAFAVHAQIPATAALLVDDLVDSRWTLTVVGAALRAAGVAAVYPLVLAQALSG